MSRARELAGFATATDPVQNLSVGIVTATSYAGDGSALSGVGVPGVSTTVHAGFNDITVAGISTFSDTTASTSTTTGALIVSGGVGIAKSLFVGGNISAGGTVTYEDVTNVDAVGIVTAGKGLRATTGGLVVTAGVSTFGDHINIPAGYSLQWDDSHERIEQSDGKIEFFTGNGEKMVLSGSNLEFPDDGKVTFGTGDDLSIYHDGSNSYIQETGTGLLYIDATQLIVRKSDGSEDIAKFVENGAVQLYYDNSKKLETTNTGVTVTGTVAATSYTGDGSSLTGIDAGVTTTSQYNQSGVITINLGTGQGHEVTLAAGISTITVTGGTAGASHHLIITQPSSGITTVGFSTYFLWPSGSPPDISRSSASSEIDMITFVVKQQTQTGTGVTQLLASAGIDYQ